MDGNRHGHEAGEAAGRDRVIPAAALDGLVAALRARDFAVMAPVIRDGAIDIAGIETAAALPLGVGDEQAPGRYRLVETGEERHFAFNAGAASFKGLLHPPERRVFHVEEGEAGLRVVSDEDGPPRPMAFFGVRACDLAAIAVLDTVLSGDLAYRRHRAGLAIVAVECATTAATCFCASMGTGPAVSAGFDLALTEIDDGAGGGPERFLARPGSALGEELLAAVEGRAAGAADRERAAETLARTEAAMGRRLDTRGLKEGIAAAAGSPHWERVAERCLTCANCTMVCPTCYCTGFRDAADLDGSHAERWRHWDSCFTLDFTFAMGGPVRQSGAARYRQWLTHKLSTWVDQFGTFGCVGCGRCIAWCPVGIDIVEEATTLLEEA